MATLTEANRQWSTRPADQRYSSLEELHAACQTYRDRARVATVPYKSLTIGQDYNGQPALIGSTGQAASFTHWSFNQLCARLNAPSAYLRRLPGPIVSANLNAGINMIDTGKLSTVEIGSSLPSEQSPNCKLLLDVNGDRTVRAFTSERYTRIWNTDITSRLIRLANQESCWQPAPPAYDGSRGLYASDRDMFAFLVDNGRRIFEADPNGGLSRGFFCWNSEVGSSTFGIETFLYNYVCGNHLVWGASNIKKVSFRHIGNADDRAFTSIVATLTTYAESSATEDELKIKQARTVILGNDKEEVLDKVFGLRIPVLSKTRIEDAYAIAESKQDWYGAPNTPWAMANGLTQIARDMEYTDDRVDLERAAGKVMEIAF